MIWKCRRIWYVLDRASERERESEIPSLALLSLAYRGGEDGGG